MLGSKLDARLHKGMWVFGGLGVLTVVEYLVAIGMNGGATPYLVAIALVKAWLILQYFMHMAQIWLHGEESHD